MSIKKIGKGLWRVEVYLGKDPLTGKKIRKVKRCDGQKEAKEFEAKWLTMSANGEIDINGKMLVNDYMDYWFKTYVKVNCAYQTQLRYNTFCKCIKKNIGYMKLEKLNPPIIQQFYSNMIIEKKKLKDGTIKRRYSNGTVLKTHKMLHLALKCAVQWQMLHANPVDNVIPPSDDVRNIKVWTIDETNSFLQLIKGVPLYDAAYIAYMTGMREGEISALKWDCVDFENNIIKVKHGMVKEESKLTLEDPKTENGKRNISIDNGVKNFLKKIKIKQQERNLSLPQDSKIKFEYVCSWPNGKPLSPQYITKTFTKYVNKYKFKKITFHGLRHTHASIMFEAGVSSNVISKRLGHARTSITDDIYIHIKPQAQKDAVEKFSELIKQRTPENKNDLLGHQ